MRRIILLTMAALLAAGCAGPAEGPLKGVLVVYTPGAEGEIDGFTEDLQLYVETVVAEPVFDFSFARMDEFEGTLRNRRTILFAVDSADQFPGSLTETETGLYSGTDVWARGQYVFGVVLGPDSDADEVSSLLLEAYDDHMWDYVYGSFVATQMSSPERIDSMSTLGFTIDIPKSYALESWRPDDGFVQYQRQPSNDCLLMFSVYRVEDVAFADDPEDAILRREAMARRFFYDAAADSVDRSSVLLERTTLNGIGGWRLTGLWRNPEHLNAGAFTSFVLDHDGTGYILDMEVYNPGREKEPYIREGWTIMNSFVPED
jgi:hypothetical protein